MLWQYKPARFRAGEEASMQYRPVVDWGQLPDGWSYVEATSVAVDAADNVYVFNRGAHPVIVFDRDGKFRRSWGEGRVFALVACEPGIGSASGHWGSDSMEIEPSWGATLFPGRASIRPLITTRSLGSMPDSMERRSPKTAPS